MPPINLDEKKHPGMDSSLADMYEAMIEGDDLQGPDTAIPLSSDSQRVQVILEMVSAEAPVPQNLGIEVETSYENLVQATVPVRNLKAIASDENVLMIRLPSTPIPAVVQPPVDNAGIQDEFDLTYILIPAIALPAIAAVVVWTKVSRR